MFCQHLIFTGKPLSWPGEGVALGVLGATRSLSTRDAAACSRGLVTLHGPVAQHSTPCCPTSDRTALQ